MADLDLVRRLSDANHLAVLATTRPDGTVHASIVSAGVLDDPTGAPAIGVVVAGNARKLDHLRRTGRAAAVFTRGFEWVTAEGPVRVIEADAPDVSAWRRQIFTAAGGTHEDWDEFDRVMNEEHRVAVLITPSRVSGNR